MVAGHTFTANCNCSGRWNCIKLFRLNILVLYVFYFYLYQIIMYNTRLTLLYLCYHRPEENAKYVVLYEFASQLGR
jgi:hypothetical protein